MSSRCYSAVTYFLVLKTRLYSLTELIRKTLILQLYHLKIKFLSLCHHVISLTYYIDTRILIENMPVKKFISNYIWNPRCVFPHP